MFITSETLIPLHIIPEGTSESERIGTSVNIESYNIHANIRRAPEYSSTNNTLFNNEFIRYGVIYDRQPDRTVFAGQPTLVGDVFTAFWGHLNRVNKNRFFVISDKYFVFGEMSGFFDQVDPGPPPVFGPPTMTSVGELYKIWKEYKKVDLKVTYGVNDTEGLEPTSGALWAFILRGKDGVPGHLLADWDIRTTYTDSM